MGNLPSYYATLFFYCYHIGLYFQSILEEVVHLRDLFSSSFTQNKSFSILSFLFKDRASLVSAVFRMAYSSISKLLASHFLLSYCSTSMSNSFLSSRFPMSRTVNCSSEHSILSFFGQTCLDCYSWSLFKLLTL